MREVGVVTIIDCQNDFTEIANEILMLSRLAICVARRHCHNHGHSRSQNRSRNRDRSKNQREPQPGLFLNRVGDAALLIGNTLSRRVTVRPSSFTGGIKKVNRDVIPAGHTVERRCTV